LAESANRRLLEEKRNDAAQGAERQSIWAAGITRLANPADRALQRYQEEQERLKAQGSQVTPGQLQHLNATRIHAQAEFAKFSGLVGHPDEAARRMGLHGFAEPAGKAETGALDKLFTSETDKRKGLLGILDKETDQRRKSYEDEQNRKGGGSGAGAAAAGAASLGMNALAMVGIPLTIAGILQAMGVFDILGGAMPVWQENTKWSARMGAMGVGNTGRVTSGGYRYGYTQEQSMPFGEQWAGTTGQAADDGLFRYGRAYNALPQLQQLGEAAYGGQSPRETHRLLSLIAANVTALGIPIGRLGEHLAMYAKVYGMTMATSFAPGEDWSGTVAGMERIMGGQYSGRTGGMLQRMNQSVQSPQGEGQRALLYRAFGGLDGASYSEVMMRMSGGIFGLDTNPFVGKNGVVSESTVGMGQRLGFLGRGGAEKYGSAAAINDVINEIAKEFPSSKRGGGPMGDTMQMEAIKGMFPGIGDQSALRIFNSIDSGQKLSANALAGIEDELKGQQSEEEKRAQRFIDAVTAASAKQEQASLAIGEKLGPLLTEIRDWVAAGMKALVPPIVGAITGPMARFLFDTGPSNPESAEEAYWNKHRSDKLTDPDLIARRAHFLGGTVTRPGPQYAPGSRNAPPFGVAVSADQGAYEDLLKRSQTMSVQEWLAQSFTGRGYAGGSEPFGTLPAVPAGYRSQMAKDMGSSLSVHERFEQSIQMAEAIKSAVTPPGGLRVSLSPEDKDLLKPKPQGATLPEIP
jgi:hypothetical protein